MTQRRPHTGHAIAELQNYVTFFADAPDAQGDLTEVPALKESDTLVAVLIHTAAAVPAVADLDDLTIVEPRAGAILENDGTNPSEDDYVTIGLVKFIFKDAPVLVESNYSVGSNRSERVVEVATQASAALAAAALADSINSEFSKDPFGVTAEVVDTDNVKVSAKQPGTAGEGIGVSHSGWADPGTGEWKDLETVPGDITETTLLVGAVAGILAAVPTDLSAADTDGVQVRYRVGENEEPQDTESLLDGNYKPGDTGFDAYGLGRLPPGWQP